VLLLPNEEVKICVAALRAVRAIGCAKIWRPPQAAMRPMRLGILVVSSLKGLTHECQSVINNHMITIIVILCAVGLLILGAVIVNHTSSASHQFPSSYTLLKNSPSIVRREMWALRVIVALMVVFLLLLVTSQF
jgi:hypothetical protein